MNKKSIIIVTIISILIAILGLWISGVISKQIARIYREEYEKQETESINVVTEVSLGEQAWINSLTKINIKDTNDYFEITEKVKWEVPEHSEHTTISFAIAIPYTFVVNDVSYNGVYQLNDSGRSKKIEGLDYNLRVVNLTKDGKIKIEVTK